MPRRQVGQRAEEKAALPSTESLATTLAAHPQVASLIVLASVAIAKQSHSSSDAGTLATARAIRAAPDTPTVAQVDAADTTTVK